jgi:hypothetical protein
MFSLGFFGIIMGTRLHFFPPGSSGTLPLKMTLNPGEIRQNQGQFFSNLLL